MKVKGKVIIVTGASSGMGRELTIQLVRKGAKVIMVDINETGLEETVEIAGSFHVTSHVLNIADLECVQKFADAVIEQYGAIDGIINNAGIIQPFADVKNLDYNTIDQIISVNFFGTLYMTKSFLLHLLERPEAHIANVSGMGGFIPFPGQTMYSASKAAVKIFTEGLYSELKNTNVGVTVIHPGVINTNIMSNSRADTTKSSTSDSVLIHKPLSVEKAASMMIEGIEANKFRVLVGNDANVLDTLYRLNPRMAVNKMVKKMGSMKH